MSKVIKTKIDGVPVTLELLAVGPATSQEVDALSQNLAAESKEATRDFEAVPANAQFRVIEVGDKDNPATDEQKKAVEEKVNAQNTAELIGNLVENISSLPNEKEWYQSRMIWVNIISIVVSIGAYFGFDLHMEPEAVITLVSVIIGVVNLILRNSTTSAIKKPSIKLLK